MDDSLSDHSLDGEAIDLDSLIRQPEEAKEESFNAELYVSQQDAALEYNDASLSSIGESETAGTPKGAETPNMTETENDLSSRLDALERVMAEDALSPTSTDGSTAEYKSAQVIDDSVTEKNTNTMDTTITETTTTSTNKFQEDRKDTTITDTAATTTTTSTTSNTTIDDPSQQQKDFDEHMARLEKVLADSPVGSKTNTLSFSALAESQRARGGDDDMSNRLHRLEQLLGPMNSPAASTSSSPANQHNMSVSYTAMTPSLNLNNGLQSSADSDSENVSANLARLELLLGSSVTPASRMTARTVHSTQFTGGRKMNNSINSTPSIPPSQQRMAGAQVENQMLRDRIVELEHQLSSRGDVIENMMNSSRISVNGNNDHGLYSELERVKRSEKISKRALVAAEAKLEEMRTKMNNMREKQRENDAKRKLELESVQQQLSHSEHRVRARESVIATLQDRLQAEVRRSQQTRERNRTTFKRVHGREIRSGSKTDQKTTEIIHMYESQRKEMDLELQQLRRDVRRLSMNLKDNENESSSTFTKRTNEDEVAGRMAKRLEKEIREVEDRAVLLQRKEEQAIRDITRMKEEVASTNEVMKKLEEVNINLKMELESRPTMRDWKKSQKMIELLQNKLRDTFDGGNGGSASSNQNEREGLQTIAGQDTSAMVRKDRENHRLKLHLLDHISRSNAIELLKDICRTFGINGNGILFQLLPTIERIQQVVLAVPRMQGFVRDICYTLRVDPSTTLGVAMEMGIEKIKDWELQMNRKKEIERLRTAIIMEIITHRSNTLITQGGTGVTDFDDVRLLAEIKGMIEKEKDVEKEEKFYDSIQEEMKTNPSEMTTRMVTHFQQLFDVKAVRGIMPKMNELFLYSSEMNTFMNAIRARLALNQHATTSAVMNALKEITSTPANGEEDGEKKKSSANNKMSNLTEEKRTRGGTSFSVTRKGVPGWKVEK